MRNAKCEMQKSLFPLYGEGRGWLLFIIHYSLFIVFTTGLFAQVETTYVPLSVGEHWSRRSVTEENGASRFYYRPHRFEWMEMESEGHTGLQLRTVLTERASSVDIFIKIGNTEQKHTLRVVRNDEYYYYAEPLSVTLPAGTQTFLVRTRNPFTYFRHYNIRHRQMRPRSYALTAEDYLARHTLTSETTSSEYFSGNDEKPIVYRADTDGDVHFFVRGIREGRLGATIEILINDTLHQTVILPNRTSNDYRLGERRVSTGTRIELPDIKKGDKITIVPKTWHEIITRLIITTKEVF